VQKKDEFFAREETSEVNPANAIPANVFLVTKAPADSHPYSSQAQSVVVDKSV
jgi:hypothetical protein